VLFRHLTRFTPADWLHVVDVLAPGIADIDRNATRIWFAFFPLELHAALEAAGPDDHLERKFGLMGQWRLADQIDKSHRFLYGHRYWPQVKAAISAADDVPDGLAEIATTIADASTRTARVDREQVLGLTLVGLMTLRQVGTDASNAAPGTIHLSAEARRQSPHQVMAARAADDWQGPLGFLRGHRKRWTVTFDENDPTATFPLINDQEIASAAKNDQRDHRNRDARCIPNEGPIPVECRAASCGTCWVGVLAGAEKLSPIDPRNEGRRLEVFGYPTVGDPSIIRLACQARATGAVSVVIPPWNGIIGKLK
jgi:ferredoxin